MSVFCNQSFPIFYSFSLVLLAVLLDIRQLFRPHLSDNPTCIKLHQISSLGLVSWCLGILVSGLGSCRRRTATASLALVLCVCALSLECFHGICVAPVAFSRQSRMVIALRCRTGRTGLAQYHRLMLLSPVQFPRPHQHRQPSRRPTPAVATSSVSRDTASPHRYMSHLVLISPYSHAPYAMKYPYAVHYSMSINDIGALFARRSSLGLAVWIRCRPVFGICPFHSTATIATVATIPLPLSGSRLFCAPYYWPPLTRPTRMTRLLSSSAPLPKTNKAHSLLRTEQAQTHRQPKRPVAPSPCRNTL